MMPSHVIQLAGVVAVEITGGPEVPFHPGREVGDLVCFLFIMAGSMSSYMICIYAVVI